MYLLFVPPVVSFAAIFVISLRGHFSNQTDV